MAAKIGGKGGRKSNVTTFPGGNGGDGRNLTSVDNLTPEQVAEAAAKQRKDREEAEAIQLLSVVSRIKAQRVLTGKAKSVFDAEKAKETDIFRAAKASGGFVRKELEDLIADSKAGARKSVEDAEARRVRFRRAMGLPVGLSDTDQDLIERLPEVERNGLYWRGIGYTDGVSGEPCDAPEACVKAGHDNLYAEGWKDGQAVLGMALTPKKKPEPAKPNPLEDPHSPESLKAHAESVKRAKASLEAMGTGESAPEGEAI